MRKIKCRIVDRKVLGIVGSFIIKSKNMIKEISKDLKIRNSTAEFLIFTSNSGENSIEVKFEDQNLWLSQKMIATLFGVSIPTINEHLKNIFNSGELSQKQAIRNFLITANDGKKYKTNFYNLEGIITIGFRVNSGRAIEFRTWARKVLKQFSIKGFVLDKERLKNGNFLGKEYFEEVLAEIKEIRASERKFYQKITDLYTTALDYDKNSKTTKKFFSKVQNKLHFAIHGNTAVELVVDRADYKKEDMGLITWKNAPKGKIIKTDVSVAKNYLKKQELEELDRIVNMYLDYGEDQAKRNIPLTMEDWGKKLDAFLQFNERSILENSGKITAEVAKEFAESQFEKYRIVQDKNYISDFDELLKLGN